MGVFDRMGRAISSNFNALLDSVEDPRKSIELTLREMSEQIRAARQEVVRGVAAEKQLRSRASQLDAEVQKWAARAELAIRHSDDDLARAALLQKKRLTAERDRAEALRAEQRGNAMEMKGELERMEQKLEELTARKGTLVAQAQQAQVGGAGASGGGGLAGGSAFGEFRRMEDQIEGVEAAMSAQREVEEVLGEGRGPGGMTRDEVEARFRALEYGGSAGSAEPQTDIDDELSALKQKIRVGKQ